MSEHRALSEVLPALTRKEEMVVCFRLLGTSSLREGQCGMSAESQNCEASRDIRCYGTALQTCPLLGNASVAVT
jgi:hypothetical protein